MSIEEPSSSIEQLPSAEAGKPHPGTRPLTIALRATPALWQKTCERVPGAAARHSEFKKSLSWLLQREGFSVQENAPARYYTQGGDINGKIDLLVRSGGAEVLAIEVDFKATPSSGWKLLGKKKQGAQALLLVGFQTTLPAARAIVDKWFNKPTISWLSLGIIAARRPRS